MGSLTNTIIGIGITTHHPSYFLLSFYLAIMCLDCVKEEFPNRDRLCADSGAYMANLKSCVNCKGNQLKAVNKVVAFESDVEITTYERKISLLVLYLFLIYVLIIYFVQ